MSTKTTKTTKTILTNISIILGIILLEFFCPQLKGHYEARCLILSFPQSIFTILVLFSYGLTIMGIISCLVWDFEGGIASIAIGIGIRLLLYSVMMFGFFWTGLLIFMLFIFVFAPNSRKVVPILSGFIFLFAFDNARPYIPNDDIRYDNMTKKVYTDKEIYANCPEVKWCIELTFSDGQIDNDGPWYVVGSYSQAEQEAENIKSNQLKKYIKDEKEWLKTTGWKGTENWKIAEKMSYKNTNIWAYYVPPEIAEKKGDFFKLKEMQREGLLK